LRAGSISCFSDILFISIRDTKQYSEKDGAFALVPQLKFSIIVVSDRVYGGKALDESGEHAVELVRKHGYVVDRKIIIPNRYREILKAIQETIDSNIVVLIGGTGPSPRDITIDLLEDIAWRKIPGFGEYFRRRSFEETGYRGLLSRSELYILYDGRVAVALPGSRSGVETGLDIFLNMVEHLVEEIHRFEGVHR